MFTQILFWKSVLLVIEHLEAVRISDKAATSGLPTAFLYLPQTMYVAHIHESFPFNLQCPCLVSMHLLPLALWHEMYME